MVRPPNEGVDRDFQSLMQRVRAVERPNGPGDSALNHAAFSTHNRIDKREDDPLPSRTSFSSTGWFVIATAFGTILTSAVVTVLLMGPPGRYFKEWFEPNSTARSAKSSQDPVSTERATAKLGPERVPEPVPVSAATNREASRLASGIQGQGPAARAALLDTASPKLSVVPKDQPTSGARLVVPPTIDLIVAQTSRFPIRVEPADAATGSSFVAVLGLPKEIKLTRGSMAGPELWIVALGDLPELMLNVLAETQSRIDLTLELRTSDGGRSVPAKTTLVVLPALGAAQSAPLFDDEAIKKLVAQGRDLLEIGQVHSARLIFQRAAGSGSADAALLLGDTYDAGRLAARGVRGISGDRDKAAYWYERADELGSAAAKDRLLGLATR